MCNAAVCLKYRMYEICHQKLCGTWTHDDHNNNLNIQLIVVMLNIFYHFTLKQVDVLPSKNKAQYKLHYF